MSRIKYAIDDPFIKPWATRIGQFILNFAGLEFESYFWLLQMSEQPERIPEFTKQPYAPRVKTIMKLIKNRSFSEQWKLDAFAGWSDALKLAQLRNRIAHNPLMFAWDSEAEEGEPDFIGVVDIKAGKKPGDTGDPFLSKADVSNAINRINSLVSNLASLREDWCAIRDKSKHTVRP